MNSRERGLITAMLDRERSNPGRRIVGYLPGCYPSEDRFRDALVRIHAEGIRIIEIGIPGAIGALEGDTISRALATVEAHGADGESVIVKSTRTAARIGLLPVVMAFRGTVFPTMGVKRFVQLASKNGAAAVLVPDATPAERTLLIAAAADRNLPVVSFVPALGDLPEVPSDAAFVYLQTADMQTGDTFEPDSRLADRIDLLRGGSTRSVPVALGFGIRTPEQVRRAFAFGADLIVVGTAMVDALNEGIDALGDFTRRIVAAREEA